MPNTPKASKPVQPPDTVKVRICVAVDTDGHWSAHGERGDSDTDMMTCSSDNVSEPYALTFVEAYVPLPRALSTVAAHSVQPSTESETGTFACFGVLYREDARTCCACALRPSCAVRSTDGGTILSP